MVKALRTAFRTFLPPSLLFALQSVLFAGSLLRTLAPLFFALTPLLFCNALQSLLFGEACLCGVFALFAVFALFLLEICGQLIEGQVQVSDLVESQGVLGFAGRLVEAAVAIALIALHVAPSPVLSMELRNESLKIETRRPKKIRYSLRSFANDSSTRIPRTRSSNTPYVSAYVSRCRRKAV